MEGLMRLGDPYFRCNCDQCRGVAMPPDPEEFQDLDYDGAVTDLREQQMQIEHDYGLHDEQPLSDPSLCPGCRPAPAPRPLPPIGDLPDLPF
jgi:hypothetical protein